MIDANSPSKDPWESAQARELFSNLGEPEVKALKRFQDYRGAKHDARQRAAATEYALSTNPLTVRDFVDWVEAWWELYRSIKDAMWGAFLTELNTKLDVVRQEGVTREKVLVLWRTTGQIYFRQDFPTQSAAADKARLQLSGEAGTRRIEQTYDADRRALGGRFGGSQLGEDTTLDNMVARLRELPPTFGNEPNALFQPRRHYRELPAVEKKGNMIKDYLESLRKTIKTGDATDPVILANGSFQVEFKRMKTGVTLQAIVYVNRSGQAVVTTYRGRK